MPFNIGAPEAMFLLVIVLVVFGAGRLPEVLGQLGKGVRTFREESSAAPTSVAAASTTRPCPSCANPLPPAARFCPNCGAAI